FNSLIVLKPRWLADTFKSIISTKNEVDKEKKGLVTLKQIESRLEKNGFKLPQPMYNKLISIWEKQLNECIGRRYSLQFLPYGSFGGIFVKTFRLSHVIQFWRNGLLLCKEKDSFLLL